MMAKIFNRQSGRRKTDPLWVFPKHAAFGVWKMKNF